MKERNKVGLIADEGFVTGFIMTGLISDPKDKNFHTVSTSTSEEELEKLFDDLIKRNDIAIVFVADFVAEKIQNAMKRFKEVVPTVMTIPTKTGSLNCD